MESSKGSEDLVAELEREQLDKIRERLRDASEIEDKKQLYFEVREILKSLTLIVSPEIGADVTYEH